MKIEGVLDEEEKKRLLQQLKDNDTIWQEQIALETKSQHLNLQEKLEKRKHTKINALTSAVEKKQDILIEQSNTHFDSIMNFRKETVEKEAHNLVQQVLEKHKGVEAIKVTEHFLEDHHNQQAVDLGEAMFHERQLVLKQMLFDHVSLKQKCFEEVKAEYGPQYDFVNKKVDV